MSIAEQYAFLVDTNRCTGCRSCAIACKIENELDDGILWRNVHQIYDEDSTQPTMYFLSMSCNHCVNPVCVEVCPTTAMHVIENGTVQIDDDKCVGCRYCEWACPYSAPKFNANAGHMSKCTMCNHRALAEGDVPACVEACPTEALRFGKLDEIDTVEGAVASFDKLPEASVTEPATRFIPPKFMNS